MPTAFRDDKSLSHSQSQHHLTFTHSATAAAATAAISGVGGDELRQPRPPVLDIKLFEEIKDLMNKAKQYEEEERVCKRKIEKYNKGIEAAEEVIAKAQEKKDLLLKRNEFLNNCLKEQQDRRKQALEYWENFGIDVRQLSTDQDAFEQYELNYTKLRLRSKLDPEGNVVATNDSHCSINLKHHDKRLEIVEHYPEILTADQVAELNKRLTASCVNPQNDRVDYKLAMIMIKKDLIKDQSAGQSEDQHLDPKTFSHQQAETRSHTGT